MISTPIALFGTDTILAVDNSSFGNPSMGSRDFLYDLWYFLTDIQGGGSKPTRLVALCERKVLSCFYAFSVPGMIFVGGEQRGMAGGAPSAVAGEAGVQEGGGGSRSLLVVLRGGDGTRHPHPPAGASAPSPALSS